MSGSLIDRVRERLAAESAPLRPNVVAEAIRAESGGVLGDTDVLSNLRVLQTELTGVGILEPLLRAEGTTDVLVTAPDAVWVDDGNGLRRTSIRFADEAAVRRLAQRLALAAGRRLDEAQPWVDGQLTGRGTADRSPSGCTPCSPPIAPAGTCLSLRVLRPATQDLATLARSGRHRRGRGRDCSTTIIAARLAFLVSGGTGAGKTTLLSAALGAVVARTSASSASRTPPSWRRGIRIWSSSSRAAPNVEGVGEVTVRDLVRQALRMRPGPHRRRRGARRRGRRPAGRAQHRSRRRCGHGAREQPRRGARAPRGARGARWAGPRRAAQPARRRGAGACCTSAGTAIGARTARARSRC